MAALAVLVHVPNLPTGKSPQEDAGVFLYAARVILDGGVPYRDVWDHKPPLLYYVDALGLLIGGGSLIGVWALQASAHACAAALSMHVLARTLGTWPALFGTSAWLLSAPRVFLFEGSFSNFHQAFIAPLQWSALALALAEERPGWVSWTYFAIGLTAGLTALLTPAGLGIWIAIGLVLLIGARRIDLGYLVRKLGLLGGGALLPVVLASIALALAGGLTEAIDQAVAYNSNYAGAATLAERADSAMYGLRLLGSSGSLFVAAVGLVAAIVALRRLRTGSPARRLVHVTLIAVPIELVLGSSTGRHHEYYWLATLPTIGALAALALHLLSTSHFPALRPETPLTTGRLVSLVATLGIVLLCVRPALLGARVLASREDGVNAAATAYVTSHTEDDAEIFVWGSRAAIYVLAERRSVTRFVYQYAPLWTRGYRSDEHINELVGVIRERRPALILDASRDSPATPPLDRVGISAFDTGDRLFVVRPALARVADVVDELYEPADPIPVIGWPVWRLREP